MNRVGDGIFKLKHPRLDSNFIMSQKPSNVLIPTLGKELTSVLQIIVLIFDTQHLTIHHKIWVSALNISYITQNLYFILEKKLTNDL